jgi:hypothetical protein
MNYRIPEFTGLFADLLERSYIGKTRLRSGRGCARHRLPRTRCPRAAGIRSERMLKATEEEHRAPAAAVVAPQLEVVLLTRHARHDIADSAPGVEAAVEEAQLGLARFEAEKAEGSAEGGRRADRARGRV